MALISASSPGFALTLDIFTVLYAFFQRLIRYVTGKTQRRGLMKGLTSACTLCFQLDRRKKPQRRSSLDNYAMTFGVDSTKAYSRGLWWLLDASFGGTDPVTRAPALIACHWGCNSRVSGKRQ
jgi:hypothetical protein